ncbi:MAG: homocysteine S-methyltransferase family protein [Ilumatobacteraceae bacterium]
MTTTTDTTSRAPMRISDAGMETVLIFEHGLDLPLFAAFTTLDHPAGRTALLDYYRGFVDIADQYGVELVLDTATWRASQGWGAKLGYDAEALDRINREAVAMVEQVRADRADDAPKIWISGAVGPAGDGYRAEVRLTVDEAKAYHAPQLRTLASADVDFATVLTMTHIDEAIGAALAAEEAGIPVTVSFTVETDGVLPSGQTLQEAVEAVDAATGNYPDGYGVNCAHPEHFADRLSADEDWCRRIGLVQANASRMSHAELDEAPELDPGNPTELGCDIATLRDRLPELAIVGGCCGTSHAHIEQIAQACVPARATT